MGESKYSKVLTVILVIVIIAIVGLLVFLAYDYINKYNTTKQASDFVQEYQEDITTGNQDITESQVEGNVTLEGLDSTPTSTTTNANTTKKQYKGYSVVGTMKIPKINFEYPVLEEVSTKSLETAVVVLYPSGDNLNLPGNTVIIGHNYRNGLFFSNIKKISNGDKIYVTDYRGKSITYEVYNIFEASSTDTSFYQRDTNGLAELTLSTCTDASNDQRTIVFAKQI
ncbi:MAG: sortase [Clostridia bacterium]|nr:sortase [Clostridia bacterium]